MRRFLHRASVPALLLMACATAGSHQLTDRLPAELPDAMTIAGWERFSGEARMGEANVVYELYVNPVRPALYEITRYRVTNTGAGADGRRRSREQTEKILWNPATVPHQPLRCFEWIAKRTWHRLWLGQPGEWHRIEPSTPAYDSEMRMAIQVYNLHNQRRAN
jgi:hypothetical protein